MAKQFARAFYSSKRWQDCRNEYAKQAKHLCERCLLKGIIKPGEIVHHITELTPDNINDPNVALSFSNLELVCRECHAELHEQKNFGKRFVIGPNGECIPTSPRSQKKSPIS